VKRRGLAGLQVLQELLAERRREAERQQRLEQQRATQRLAAEATQRREANLFARSVGPVTPLRTALRADVRRAKPAPLPRQRERDEREVLRESLTDEMDTESLIETDDALSWHRHWVGPDVLRKLRRGVWVVQGQVDLHGLRRDEAREALALFLAGALRRGWRCMARAMVRRGDSRCSRTRCATGWPSAAPCWPSRRPAVRTAGPVR
jgi:DNA-nicking Smr family endonuclease